MKLNIPGAEYTVVVKKYDEDTEFSEGGADGYCSAFQREIVLCDMATYKGFEHEPPEVREAQQREVLRHEIIHAFLWESGLGPNANTVEGSWAENEEMVDWFAIQGQKIYKAWQQAGALDSETRKTGPVGPTGPIGVIGHLGHIVDCPHCGNSCTTYDPVTETSTCVICGWNNKEQALENRRRQIANGEVT